jgi:prevent-host-death family protein
MDSKNTISLTEARKRIFAIAEDVQKPGKFYTFTENGSPKAVLMSSDQFDSLIEDLELANDPGFAKRMEAVEKEFERGDYVSLDELKKELHYNVKKEYVVMERTLKKNQYKTKKRKK